jgi:hypothetical protein
MNKLDRQQRGRRRWLAPLFILTLLGGFAALEWLRRSGPSWVELKDPQGLFTLDFPDTPKKSSAQQQTWTGAKTTVRSFAYGDFLADEFYGVDACTYDQVVPAEKVELIFDRICDGFVKSLKASSVMDAKVRSSKPWTHAGQPGRELVVEFNEGTALMVNRFLLVDGKHMVVLKTGVHEHHHGENDVRFLESFKLLAR